MSAEGGRAPKRFKLAKATSNYPKHTIIGWYGDPTVDVFPESSIERGSKPNCRINDEGALLATTKILKGAKLILPYTPEEGAGVRPPPAFTYLELKLEIWNQSKTIKPQYDQVGKKLDNTPGSGMSGHLTPSDMLTALGHLKVDEFSFFWDYGCSTGIVAVAASLCFEAKSGGCDINEGAIQGFTNIKKAILENPDCTADEAEALERVDIQHSTRCPPDITHAYAFWTGWPLLGKQDAWRRMRDSNCGSIILIDKEENHNEFESSPVLFPEGVGTGWTRTEIDKAFKQSVGGASYKARLWTRTREQTLEAVGLAKANSSEHSDAPIYSEKFPIIAYGKVRTAKNPRETPLLATDPWETEYGLAVWHDLFEIKEVHQKGNGVVSKVRLEPGQIAWVEALAPLTKTNDSLQKYRALVRQDESNIYKALYRRNNQSPLNLGVPNEVTQLMFVNDHDYFHGANVKIREMSSSDLSAESKIEVGILEVKRAQVARDCNVKDATKIVWLAVMVELPIFPGEEILWSYNDDRTPAPWHMTAAFADLSVT